MNETTTLLSQLCYEAPEETWKEVDFQKPHGDGKAWGKKRSEEVDFSFNPMLNIKTFTFCCRKGNVACKGRKTVGSLRNLTIWIYARVKNILRKLKNFQYTIFKVLKKEIRM